MYATSPYSDPVVSADIDPQPIIDEEEGLIWVVGPVLAVVFIICIVIAILLYKRWVDTSQSQRARVRRWESIGRQWNQDTSITESHNHWNTLAEGVCWGKGEDK